MKENHDKDLFEELLKIYESTTGNKLPEATRYDAGSEVYAEGYVPKGVYYIKEGTVKITRNNHENPVVVRLAGQHEFIGFLSLLKRWDYNSTAIALEQSQIYFIPKQLFLEAVQSSPKFTNLVVEIVCTRLNEKELLLTDLFTKSVQERLAVLLLTLDRNPRDGKIHILKKDIAAVLNIKAETLSRNLMRLQKIGAVTLHPKENMIEILSREKLLQLSHITD